MVTVSTRWSYAKSVQRSVPELQQKVGPAQGPAEIRWIKPLGG